MADIKQSALELIGNTPILQLNRYSEKAGIKDVTLLAKLEYLNPAGSVKDRIALAMIEDAEKKGKRCDNHRAYIRQHRHRPCSCCNCQRLQGNPDTAGYNEC